MEVQRTPALEAEIEAVRAAEGYNGLNNFRGIMPGGYRYQALLDNPDFGNTKDPNRMQGKSIREFVEQDVRSVMGELGIDQTRVEQLQRAVLKSGSKVSLKELNDYIFPSYRILRLKGFSHADCAG